MFKTKMRRSDNVADALFFGFNSPALSCTLFGSNLSAFLDGEKRETNQTQLTLNPVAGKSDKSNHKEFCIFSCIYPRYLLFNTGYIALDLIISMTISIALILLGVLTQAVVLITSRSSQVRFNRTCKTCGYQIPPMERSPAFHDCPECTRKARLSDSLPPL